jgi:sulfur carrier protein ThiS
MIRLTIGTNTKRSTVVVEPETILADVLEEQEVSTAGAALHLNGTLIPGVDIDNSLEELGVQDNTSATLIAVVKADSAVL